MSSYNSLAGLELEVAGLRCERQSVDVSSGFTRVTTTVVLEGAGVEGRGEDVSYEAADHDGFPTPDLRGRWTLAGLATALDDIELYPARAPSRPSSRDYRRWAFESAALDLALRQSRLSLGAALDRPYQPVRFVVSTRGDAFAWHAVAPELEFKLDPSAEWTSELIERLAALDRVRVLDLKAYYEGTAVDSPPDADLYRALADAFPAAVLEDAWLEGEAGAALAGEEARLSFDAPIHSLADLDGLPVSPGFLNVKPSRFATLARLLECLDACELHGIAMYGGGQFELGVGRVQIQALASLFYPDGPNDVAPSVYNEGEPRAGLPPSPLLPPERPLGFG